MSIASLGIVGGLAGTALPQRAAEAGRVESESSAHSRATESSQHAEDAAGIGQTAEDSQTSERDADGRRLWERPLQPKAEGSKIGEGAAESHLPKDPSGAAGGLLDVVG